MLTQMPKNPNVKPEDIVGREVRHVSYSLSHTGDSDVLVAKEYIYLKDGTRLPNLNIVKDFKRPFWISTVGRQKEHKDKLQWDSVNNLREYSCAQWELSRRIHSALDGYGRVRSLRELLQNPYVYGAGIKPQCLLKDIYMTKYADYISPKSTAAMLDIETDVLNGTGEPILISVTFKNKIFTGIKRSYINSSEASDDIHRERILKRINELLGELIASRGIEIELFFGDTGGEICKKAIERTHQWQPDFVAIWNMDFDLPKIITALEKDGEYLPDIFSDPRVPFLYRTFSYNPGPTVKTTHDGRTTPIPIDGRWPTVDTPCSYFWIDAMCLYARLRIAGGREESYALDYVLNKNIKRGKLRFDATDHLSKLDWHIEMQANYKTEYIAYNIFDCIGMELLDERTGDLEYAFAPLCDRSDYIDFKSDPTQISDAMHFHCLKYGYVFGTCSGDIRDENDSYVVKPKGWIVTLDAFLAQDIGLPIVKGLPNHKTMVTIHNSDLDIEGTYPSIQDEANACKETTIREMVSIEGLNENEKREIGVNLSAGEVNACSIAKTAYQLPDKKELLELFIMEHS